MRLTGIALAGVLVTETASAQSMVPVRDVSSLVGKWKGPGGPGAFGSKETVIVEQTNNPDGTYEAVVTALRRDGDDAHHSESADDREQCLDDAEEAGAGVAVVHVLPLLRLVVLRSRVRNFSTVSRTSPIRSPRRRSAVAMSRLS